MTPPRLYRLLSRLAPRSFRDRHAAEMHAQLSDDLAAHRRAGHRAPVYWARACLSMLTTLPSLWLAALRRRSSPSGPSPTHRGNLVDNLLQDLRYAVRGLLARPLPSLLCALAIALGIGANATVFTVANEIFLRPLPVEEPARLADLHVEQPGANSFVGFSFPEYEELRGAAGWVDIAATSGARLDLGGEDGTPVIGQFASANHLPMLGVEVASGRLYGPDDDLPGASLVAVASHGFWQRRMAGSTSTIGSTIDLDGHAVTIVGVLAPPFQGRFIGFPSELWLPLHAIEVFRPGTRLADRTAQPLELIGRLEPGITQAAATAALNVVAASLEEEFPDTQRDRRVSVTPFTGLDSSLRAGVLGFVGILGALSALVLMAACLNVGNLLLARGQARAPEFATRLALGGSRRRIVRQVLTETMVLFTVGAVGASLLNLALTGAMRAAMGALPVPAGLEFRVDWTVLLATASAAALTALITGTQPALRAAAAPPADSLRTARSGAPRDRRIRQAFVAAQVAVSVVLLLMAGLFLRALQQGLDSDPGFPADGLQLAGITLDIDQHTPTEAALLLEQVTEAARNLPGVATAALGSSSPVGVTRTPTAVNVPGRVPPAGQEAFFVDLQVVGPGFLETVAVPLVSGRYLAPDDDADGAPVALVNRTLAALLWADDRVVGEPLLVGDDEVTVVGVVADTRHIVQDPDSGPLLYLPFAQRPRHTMLLVVRSGLQPAALEQELDRVVTALAPDAGVGTLRQQRDLLDDFLLPQRIASRVAGGLGLLGTVLAITGIYGMVAFAVAARRREMGIRMALGAAPSSTVGILLRSALLLVGTGAAVGLVAGLALGPLVGSFLLGVSPADPVTMFAVLVGILCVAAAAAWLPARRAATIDPAAALRDG